MAIQSVSAKVQSEQTGPELQDLNILDLKEHPNNPRLVMRDDVIEGIKAGILANGSFSPKFALSVRPFDGAYQVLAGHHRLEAARQLGIKILPCWIEQMNDESAEIELIRSNAQGELSLLEIALHVLKNVPPDKRGRGAKGNGIYEYGKKIGKPGSVLARYVKGAQVFVSCKERFTGLIIDNVVYNEKSILDNELRELINHLVEISRVNQSCWFIFVKLLLEKKWTVQETNKAVKRAQEFTIPEPWQSIFLPLPDVVHRALDTQEFSPQTANKLIEQAESVEARIATYKTNTDEFIASFREWLKANTGGDSWDVRKIIEYGRELQAKVEAAEREENERFMLGDWRECIEKLKDDSVALLLTDPPYGMDYQSDYRLNRDNPRKHETIQNDGKLDAAKEITDCLSSLNSKLKSDAHILCFCHWSNEHQIRQAIEAAGYKIRGSLIWVKNNTGMGDPKTTFAPKHERIIHAVKGSPVLFSRTADVLMADRVATERHPTEKPVDLLEQLIEVTTVKDELVIDPFAGVASTLVAAKGMGRGFFGCEISEEYYRKGSERL